MILWRSAVNGLCFVVGLVLACGVIGRTLPLPDVPQVKEKLEWLREHRDEIDVLFLGTSRVRRHVMPGLFDRLAAERGLRVRSFNLGIDSLFSPEDSYVLDQALAAASLRYVFIELSYFRQDFSGQPPDSIRAAYWHDARRTWTILRRLAVVDWRQIKPRRKRKTAPWSGWLSDVATWTGLATRHIQLFFQCATNLGRGSAFLRAAFVPSPPPDRLAPLGPARDGFIPSDADTVLRGSPLSLYEQQLAKLRKHPERALPLDPVAEAGLTRMVAAVRRHGAQPILFTPPNSAGAIFLPSAPLAPILDFSNPHEWPELFDPRHRADIGHLNTAGAEAFTRALAGRFLRSIEGGADPRTREEK